MRLDLVAQQLQAKRRDVEQRRFFFDQQNCFASGGHSVSKSAAASNDRSLGTVALQRRSISPRNGSSQTRGVNATCRGRAATSRQRSRTDRASRATALQPTADLHAADSADRDRSRKTSSGFSARLKTRTSSTPTGEVGRRCAIAVRREARIRALAAIRDGAAGGRRRRLDPSMYSLSVLPPSSTAAK